MSAIFISHATVDNDAIEGLKERLAAQNHHSFFLDFDPDQGFQTGHSWERTLYRKMRACRAVIVWCTENYIKSYWCFAELALARMEGKHIFAILADPLGPETSLPSILADKQYIDLRQGEELGFERLWNGLRKLDILGASDEWDPKEPPYLGLNRYEEKHAPVFFGREDEIRAGLEMIHRGAPNLMMVLGASGSGKSSLTCAGILPRLRRESDHYLMVDPFRPRLDPFGELADALGRAFRRFAPEEAGRTGDPSRILQALRSWKTTRSAPISNDARSSEKAADERVHRLITELEELTNDPPTPRERFQFLDWTLDDLRRVVESSRGLPETVESETPLIDLARQLLRFSGRREARVILVIDQFEELLGHSEEPDHPANDFLELLRATLDAEDSPLLVLGTMRSDFLGAFQQTQALRGLDFESLSLGSMPVEGMRKVIEEPARLGALELEKGLSDRLIADTETPDALPLLSFTLWVMWRDYRQDGRLSIREYEELGGLDGAVSREADLLLRAAENERQAEALRRAFVRMARLSDQGSYARQPVSWDADELKPVHGILDRFVDRRLLVKTVDKGETQIEVAHEALFRSWAPLVGWLDANRADLLLKQQVERDAAAWDEEGRQNERLWIGGRLQQAGELAQRQQLPDVEREFVNAGLGRAKRKRNAWILGVTTALAILSALSGFALLQSREANLQRNEAESQRQIATDQRNEAQRLAGDACLLLADSNRNRSEAMFYAARALGFEGLGKPEDEVPEDFPRLLQLPEAIEESGQALRFVYSDSALLPFVWSSPPAQHFSSGSVWVSWSPDGRKVAACSDSQKVVRVFDVETGDLVSELEGHEFWLSGVAWSPDGRILASGSDDRTIKLWDVDRGVELDSFEGHRFPIKDLAWSPDGKYIAACDQIYTSQDSDSPDIVHVWEVEQGERVMALTGHSNWINCVAWSPDGHSLASGSRDGSAIVWNIEKSGSEFVTLDPEQERIRCLAWSPDGKRLALGSDSNEIEIWDPAEGELAGTFDGHSAGVLSLAWSPDGKTLASGSYDRSVKIWDAETGGVTTSFVGGVRSLDWSPGGESLASGDLWTAQIRIWDLDTSKPRGSLNSVFLDVAWNSAGEVVASASAEGTITLFDVRSEREMRLSGHTGQVNSIAWARDDSFLVSGSSDGSVRIWNPETGEAISSFELGEEVSSIALSPNGGRLALSFGHSVEVRELESESEPLVFEGHDDLINDLAWSHSGAQIASASDDGTVRIWNAESGEEIAALSAAAEAWMQCVAWSPDDAELASGTDGHTLTIWDAREWTETLSYGGLMGEFRDLAWHPNGYELAIADGEGIGIWNVQNPEEEKRFLGHTAGVNAVIWGLDGRVLASASDDGTFKIWLFDRDESVATVGNFGDRALRVALSPDGKRVAAGGYDDAVVKAWDVATGEQIGEFQISEESGKFVWSPDGTTLAVPDGSSLQFRNLESGETTTKPISNLVREVVWRPDGELFAVALEYGVVEWWKPGADQPEAVLAVSANPIGAMEWSPDGKIFAVASFDSVFLLDADSQQLLDTFSVTTSPYSEGFWCVAWSPDGRSLAAGDHEGGFRVWDVKSREERFYIRQLDRLGAVHNLRWSPGGDWLATASLSGVVDLWSPVDGGHLGSLLGKATCWNLDLDSDGRIATVDELGDVRIFEPRTDGVDLYGYVREGWCRFARSSGEILWESRATNLYRSPESGFRNTPPWSALGRIIGKDN